MYIHLIWPLLTTDFKTFRLIARKISQDKLYLFACLLCWFTYTGYDCLLKLYYDLLVCLPVSSLYQVSIVKASISLCLALGTPSWKSVLTVVLKFTSNRHLEEITPQMHNVPIILKNWNLSFNLLLLYIVLYLSVLSISL